MAIRYITAEDKLLLAGTLHAAATIIQTLDGNFYRVTETGSSDLAHVWNGVRVMRKFGEWVDRKNARVELVRKVGARLFSNAEVA